MATIGRRRIGPTDESGVSGKVPPSGPPRNPLFRYRRLHSQWGTVFGYHRETLAYYTRVITYAPRWEGLGSFRGTEPHSASRLVS